MTDAPSGDDVNQAVDPLGGYRSPRRLVLGATIALLFYVVAVVAATAVGISIWFAATGASGSEDFSTSQALRTTHIIHFVGQSLLVVACANAILCLLTLYRFAANARALTQQGFSAPISIVVWFFVPFLNLFMPYLVLQQVWKASGPSTRRWHENPPSGLIRRWWAIWLIAIALAVTGRYPAEASRPSNQFRVLMGIGIVNSAVHVMLASTSILLLRRFFSMQEQRYAMLRAKLEGACSHCGEQCNRTEPVCPLCGASARNSLEP